MSSRNAQSCTMRVREGSGCLWLLDRDTQPFLSLRLHLIALHRSAPALELEELEVRGGHMRARAATAQKNGPHRPRNRPQIYPQPKPQRRRPGSR